MTDRYIPAVRDILLGQGWKLATAESCTGGLVAHEITTQVGCSAWYCGGVVAYADSTKTSLLSVPANLISEHGAVSRPVARDMAVGACQRIPEADIAISITGIAGPDGGTDDKPVGLVYVGLATVEGSTQICEYYFQGTRSDIQIAASHAAWEMLYQRLSENVISKV